MPAGGTPSAVGPASYDVTRHVPKISGEKHDGRQAEITHLFKERLEHMATRCDIDERNNTETQLFDYFGRLRAISVHEQQTVGVR